MPNLPPILLLLACLAIAFLLSGMEAGVFALSRLRIRQQMRAGNPRARALHGYLEHPEHFLWTILVGNTLASVAAVALVVAGWHQWLGGRTALFLPALLASLVLFYTLCELLPKMIFRQYPNRLCMFMALPFGIVHLALRPLVALMAWLANGLLRWSGGRTFTGHLFGTRDELRIVMQESAQGFTTEERTMINRVLDLQNLTVGQITIPLEKVVMVSDQASVSDLLALGRERGFTRLPLWKAEGTRRRIAGLVNLNSLLYRAEGDVNQMARDFLKPALYLDSEMRLEVALRHMQRSGQRLAIVLGRDRAEIGAVALQDVLKVIFGEVSL